MLKPFVFPAADRGIAIFASSRCADVHAQGDRLSLWWKGLTPLMLLEPTVAVHSECT